MVEAKAPTRTPGDGLQQAKDYAEILGLKFAYATNGHGIVEFDYTTGMEREIVDFPDPDELWTRLKASRAACPTRPPPSICSTPILSPRRQDPATTKRSPSTARAGHRPRPAAHPAHHGDRHRQDPRRVPDLLEAVEARWNRTGDHRRPRILYLADRNILIDDPKDKIFAPFGDARWKIEGEAIKSREMYFAIYQSIARDENRPGLYREYAPDFFDLIIVDECHRGSARTTATGGKSSTTSSRPIRSA